MLVNHHHQCLPRYTRSQYPRFSGLLQLILHRPSLLSAFISSILNSILIFTLTIRNFLLIFLVVLWLS